MASLAEVAVIRDRVARPRTTHYGPPVAHQTDLGPIGRRVGGRALLQGTLAQIACGPGSPCPVTALIEPDNHTALLNGQRKDPGRAVPYCTRSSSWPSKTRRHNNGCSVSASQHAALPNSPGGTSEQLERLGGCEMAFPLSGLGLANRSISESWSRDFPERGCALEAACAAS